MAGIRYEAHGISDMIVTGWVGYCEKSEDVEPHEYTATMWLYAWDSPEYDGRTVASIELDFPCGDSSGTELALGDAILLRDRLTAIIDKHQQEGR